MIYTSGLQSRLERAVLNHERTHGAKPRLLQINREDFDELLPRPSAAARFGLSIKGVTTIGLPDIAPGQYFLIG